MQTISNILRFKNILSNVISIQFFLIIIISNNALAQTTATIYTPNNTPVTVLILNEMTATQIANTNATAVSYYPYATIISDASAKYNCHAYAWYLTECSGCIKYWMNTPNDDKYWQDSSYIEVPESQAQKISYADDDHSAIKSVVSGKYDSKWGQWPVMRHSPNYTPYVSTNLKFYKKAEIAGPEIAGPDSFCSSATYTLDTSSISSGATITWEASPSHLFVNASGTDSSATIQSTSSGEGQIIFQISLNGNDFTVSKDIQFGPPLITAEGYSYNNSPTYPLLPYISVANNSVNEVPAYVTAYFSLVGATSSMIDIIDQSDPSIVWGGAIGPNNVELFFDFYGAQDPYGPQQQWVIFRVTANGGCGNATYDVAFYWQDSEMFAIYPNPADDNFTVLYQQPELTININKDAAPNKPRSFNVKLLNFNRQLVYQKESELGKNKMAIETSQLPAGIYFLQITNGKENITKKIIIAH